MGVGQERSERAARVIPGRQRRVDPQTLPISRAVLHARAHTDSLPAHILQLYALVGVTLCADSRRGRKEERTTEGCLRARPSEASFAARGLLRFPALLLPTSTFPSLPTPNLGPLASATLIGTLFSAAAGIFARAPTTLSFCYDRSPSDPRSCSPVNASG